MDVAVTAVCLAALAAGVALMAVLYRRPDSRPLVRSGYTVAAVLVVFLAAAGVVGALGLPARSSTEIAVAAMRGVVEGFYSNAHIINITSSRASMTRGALGAALLDALRAAESAGPAAGGCRVYTAPYALAYIVPMMESNGETLPGPVFYVLVDPRAPEGWVFLESKAPGNYSGILSEAGLRVAGGLSGLHDPVLSKLSMQCGGIKCFWGAIPASTSGGAPLGAAGSEGEIYRIEVPGPGGYEWIVEMDDRVLRPPRGGYVALVVAPGSLERALYSVWLYANRTGMALNLSVAPAVAYSLVIADLPDGCYAGTTPQALPAFLERVYAEAAPPGYRAFLFGSAYQRAGGLEGIGSMATAGSIVGLAVLASVVIAAAPPLAASGSSSLARSVALLRLRGYTLGILRRRLAALSAASLLAGGSAGFLAAAAFLGGSTAYTGSLGLYAAAGLAVVAGFLMYRRASGEAASIYLEAVARGSPMASLPSRPPEGLGWAGWLGLALGVYHALRGYAGFTTAEYLSRNWERLSGLSPALQALLAVWAIVEMLTAPFAPALLAYGSARLLAWKAPAIASSRLVRALLGRAAPAARGFARLVSGRAVALATLAVLATGLVAASTIAGPAASQWASRAAASTISPGLLAVKPVEPGPSMLLNYTLTYRAANGSVVRENRSLNVTLYNVRGEVEAAEEACPSGIVAVGLPAVRALGYAGPRVGEGVLLDLYGSAFTGGSPGVSVLLVFKDTRGALSLYRGAGVELDEGQVKALETPGHSLLYPSSRWERGSSGGGGFWMLRGAPASLEAIPVKGWVGVGEAPGADVVWWYANATGGSLGRSPRPRVYILGSWAFHYVDGVVGYPSSSHARPVVVVYTLGTTCRSTLEEAGFHVYSPRDLLASREFEAASAILRAAHPSSFLAPAALASSILALASAALLALDAEREVSPFMALLRLRGAGRGDGARISLALWGAFLASSTAVGLLAGLGVALGALGLVTGAGGGEFTYRAAARLPDGVPVTVAFTGLQARALALSWESLALPVILGLALLAPLLVATLRVFRGPVAPWARQGGGMG